LNYIKIKNQITNFKEGKYMKITVLGKWGPYPKVNGACSGYLLEDENYKILIDCGNGVLSRLFGFIDSLNDINAIVLTHLHSDHISDVMVLRYAVGINKEKGLIDKSIPLYAPTDSPEILNEIQFKDAFELNSLNESTKLTFGRMSISFKLMSHPVETYAVIVEKEGKKLVYSSDTKLCDGVIEIGKEADLFICESNLLEKDRTQDAYHLSAQQVGKLATEANVKKLLITHLWPEYEPEDVLNEVVLQFDGDARIAEEFKTYEI
jgi:ribonuclease BN (tRNA processing enzyme)